MGRMTEQQISDPDLSEVGNAPHNQEHKNCKHCPNAEGCRRCEQSLSDTLFFV